jgi:hypothetical protein
LDLCICSSHSSSDESFTPGPFHTLKVGSRPCLIKCSLILRNSNLDQPWHSQHGQCTRLMLNRFALWTVLTHSRSSRRRFLLSSVSWNFTNIIFSNSLRTFCCQYDNRIASIITHDKEYNQTARLLKRD